MKRHLVEAIEAQIQPFESVARAKGLPVLDSEIAEAEQLIGISFPESYREFLRHFGAAAMDGHYVYGLRPVEVMEGAWSVVEANKRFRKKGWPNITDWLIVATGGDADPVGIAPDGKVYTAPYLAGYAIEYLAEDFEDFLWRHCVNQGK